MHKWSRTTKAQVSLFLAVFSLLALSSYIFNDGDGDGDGSYLIETRSWNARNSFPTYIDSNASSPGAKPAPFNGSDWSKACAAPRTRKNSSSRRGRQSSELNWGSEDSDGGIEEDDRSCDLFSGRWVYDNVSYPLYDEGSCPYMSDQLACHKHGRPDLDYQKWRWQPHGCNLKRWNATEMLEKLRGKRLMFVGDSLNRGQWISMICVLQSVIPADKKSITPNAKLTVFKALDYNATVEFYWAPLLVESNSDDPVNHRLAHRIIRPNALLKHAILWEKADILVFNTYLWWRSGSKIKLLWTGDGDAACEEVDGLESMKLSLETWADWVASYVDILKKRVFYVTMSPTHLWSWEWNAKSEGNCFSEQNPITKQEYWGTGSDIPTMHMVSQIMHSLRSKVSVLNITQLSEYRKDGHPSIYRKFWETFSKQQLSNPSSYADCIHWCLPGVPDTWNQLLFHLL